MTPVSCYGNKAAFDGVEGVEWKGDTHALHDSKGISIATWTFLGTFDVYDGVKCVSMSGSIEDAVRIARALQSEGQPKGIYAVQASFVDGTEDARGMFFTLEGATLESEEFHKQPHHDGFTEQPAHLCSPHVLKWWKRDNGDILRVLLLEVGR